MLTHQGACSVVWGGGRSRAKHVCALCGTPLPGGKGAEMPLNSIALAATVAVLHTTCCIQSTIRVLGRRTGEKGISTFAIN